ncbi:hypothetical protein ASG47_19800 [Devosia sp. Leaf420]|nr:hypothetical protein ASG47_19800 [Devosia sp. Leaf420]
MRKPDIFADLSLYFPEFGGRAKPLTSDFRVPCKVSRTATNAWDVRMYFDGGPIYAGETRRVGLLFLTSEGEQAIRKAGKFFIWEGRIVGEATVCTKEPDFSG